jgi:hypothetical protein
VPRLGYLSCVLRNCALNVDDLTAAADSAQRMHWTKHGERR